jgi:hypothetical protein
MGPLSAACHVPRTHARRRVRLSLPSPPAAACGRYPRRGCHVALPRVGRWLQQPASLRACRQKTPRTDPDGNARRQAPRARGAWAPLVMRWASLRPPSLVASSRPRRTDSNSAECNPVLPARPRRFLFLPRPASPPYTRSTHSSPSHPSQPLSLSPPGACTAPTRVPLTPSARQRVTASPTSRPHLRHDARSSTPTPYGASSAPADDPVPRATTQVGPTRR